MGFNPGATIPLQTFSPVLFDKKMAGWNKLFTDIFMTTTYYIEAAFPDLDRRDVTRVAVDAGVDIATRHKCNSCDVSTQTETEQSDVRAETALRRAPEATPTDVRTMPGVRTPESLLTLVGDAEAAQRAFASVGCGRGRGCSPVPNEGHGLGRGSRWSPE